MHEFHRVCFTLNFTNFHLSGNYNLIVVCSMSAHILASAHSSYLQIHVANRAFCFLTKSSASLSKVRVSNIWSMGWSVYERDRKRKCENEKMKFELMLEQAFPTQLQTYSYPSAAWESNRSASSHENSQLPNSYRLPVYDSMKGTLRPQSHSP